VIEIGGVTVYHARRTCLFGDMKLIAGTQPDRRRRCCDRRPYTMTPRRLVAAEFVGAKR